MVVELSRLDAHEGAPTGIVTDSVVWTPSTQIHVTVSPTTAYVIDGVKISVGIVVPSARIIYSVPCDWIVKKNAAIKVRMVFFMVYGYQ